MIYPMLQGISEKEIPSLLLHLGAYTRQYEKGEYVLLQGDRMPALGLLLAGKVFMEKEDVFGKIFLYLEISLYSPWAVPFLYPALETSDVSCRAAVRSKFLYIPWERLQYSDPDRDGARQRLLRNLLEAVIQKNRILMEKINILSRKSLQERIWLYLRGHMKSPEDTKLVSSLNRTELSRFLSVNRSALSRELSRMEEQGLLRAYGKTYMVLQPKKIDLLRSPPLFPWP